MAKQDDYVRYTIRLPAPLYNRVREAAGEKSVNAEIIARLEASFHALNAETGHFKLGGGGDSAIHAPAQKAQVDALPPDVRAGDLDNRLTAIQDELRKEISELKDLLSKRPKR